VTSGGEQSQEIAAPSIWAHLITDRPLAAGVSLVAILTLAALGCLIAAAVTQNERLADRGGIILLAAAVLGGAFSYGLWVGQRPRRIRAERQLDLVTRTAIEVRDLMRAAAGEPGARPGLTVVGMDSDAEPDTGGAKTDQAPGGTV